MPESSRKRPREEIEDVEDSAPGMFNSGPARLVLTGPDFALDRLLQEQATPEAAIAAHDAALVGIGTQLRLVLSNDPDECPSEDEAGSDSELPEQSDADAEPDASHDPAKGPADDAAGSDDEVQEQSDADTGPDAISTCMDEDGCEKAKSKTAPKKRQRGKKKLTDKDGNKCNEGLANARDGDTENTKVKKSTLDNRKRRAMRKKSKARRKLLLRSLLEKALKHTEELDLRALPHSKSSYLGSHSKADSFKPTINPSPLQQNEAAPPSSDRTQTRLQELLSKGYTVVDSHSAPDLIFDGTSRLGAWKPGFCGNPGYWNPLIEGLSQSFQTFADGISQARSRRQRRKNKNASGGAPRGEHTWAKWGYSFGGGEKAPTPTAQLSKKERGLWEDFLACPFFQEVTDRLMDSFEMWAPDVYKKYDECHRYILSQMQALDCINPRSPGSVPFAALTANLGPQTVCWPHCDIKNLAHGLCLILVLGSFNYRYGGHIVLHEPRLILEMKPGDAVFLPSAVITHETIPVQALETRYSLVFYSAGGLFRWKDCAARSNKDFEKEDKKGFDLHFSIAKAEERWTAGWNCFPTLQELCTNAGIDLASSPKPSVAAHNHDPAAGLNQRPIPLS